MYVHFKFRRGCSKSFIRIRANGESFEKKIPRKVVTVQFSGLDPVHRTRTRRGMDICTKAGGIPGIFGPIFNKVNYIGLRTVNRKYTSIASALL